MSYNVKSLKGLIAWLGKFPLETTYEYADSRNCLAARYFHAHGLEYGTSTDNPIQCTLPESAALDNNFNTQIERISVEAFPKNYGRALKIAKGMKEIRVTGVKSD